MKGRKMLRIIPIVIFLVVCPALIQSCSEGSYYDIVVVNDAWLFGSCSIYLDDELQFTLDVEESDTIRQVKEGKHTITARDFFGILIAKQTFYVSGDQQWLIADHFDWNWVSDYWNE
jgi:hypothetical protein